jgi:alpha-tubulin suppressor-like RCC1 family protein
MPTRVVGGLTFDELVLGNMHSCGRTEGGAVYCWGGNTFGQLGDGTKDAKSAPVRVGEGLVFRSITAGGFQTCGVTQAGEAYCWGKDPTLPLGDANAAVLEPKRVGTSSFGGRSTQ